MTSPLIVTRIMGGLGNQLFQYAMARALADSNGYPLYLDLSEFEKSDFRKFQLDRFTVSTDRAPATEMLVLRLQRSVIGAAIPASMRYYEISELSSRFREVLISPEVRKVSLVGYWQSEKYFASIAAQIRKEVCLRSPVASMNLSHMNTITRVEAVSLHVRRGDYVTNPVAAAVLGACDIDYYQRAIAHVEKTVQNPQFFVFSDDMEWVKTNLQIRHPVTFIENNTDDPCEDLRLMAACKHFIIANSSFSWWGAWLSENVGKIVVAPQRWFSAPNMDDRDLIPKNWVRL